MTNTFKWFSLLLLLILKTIIGQPKSDLDKYRVYVTDIDPAFHCFALSNQMVCYVARNHWMTDPLPEVGAEIRLAPKKRNPALTMMEQGEFLAFFSLGILKKLIPVWMTQESYQYFLTYVSTEKIYPKPVGWCSAPINVIELSDGSKWITENKSKLGLVGGDHVLINRIDDHQCWLIDIDRTTIEGGSKNAKFVSDNGVVVKPYVLEENSESK